MSSQKVRRILYDPNRGKGLSEEMTNYLKGGFDVQEYINLDTTPLPMITSAEEFHERMKEYDREKELRCSVFFHKTDNGWWLARKMYYDAIKQIHFVSCGLEEMKKIIPTYKRRDDITNLKKLIISIRKTSKCCLELQLYEEGTNLCESAMKLVKENNLPQRYLYLIYGILGRIYAWGPKKQVNRGLYYVEKGLRHKDSPFLDWVKGELNRVLDTASEEDKIWIVKQRKWILVKEKSNKMLEESFEKDQRERERYLFSKDVFQKPEVEVVRIHSNQINFDVYIHRSLFI